MNSQIFSKEFLQAIPEKERKERQEKFFLDLFLSMYPQVLENARKKRVRYNFPWYRYIESEKNKVASYDFTLPTTKDVIEFFKTKFPNCKVTEEDMFIDNFTETKKVIAIDWS